MPLPTTMLHALNLLHDRALPHPAAQLLAPLLPEHGRLMPRLREGL
jgi:hypothetical protein